MAKLNRDRYEKIIQMAFPVSVELRNDVEPSEFAAFKARVKSGDTIVNKHIKDQIKMIDSMVADPDYYVDLNAINNFVKFVETEMTLTDGTPAKGKISPSFKLWAEDVLAWYKKRKIMKIDPKTRQPYYEEGFERVRQTVVLIVGRGNAKSLFSTWIAAYLLTTSIQKITALAAADTIEHAKLLLEPLATAINNPVGPLYQFMSERRASNKGVLEPSMVAKKDEIVNTATDSHLSLNAMSDANFQSFRPNLVLLDEVHQVRENVIQSAIESASKTKNPLILITTSEGIVREGVFDSNKEVWEKILKSYEPNENDIHAPQKPNYSTSIWWYRLDSLDEVKNPEMWEKANPNIGITVQPDTLNQDIETMKTDITTRPGILSHRFGIPMVDSTDFFSADDIKRRPDLYTDPKPGQNVYMGVDLSGYDDLTSFTFFWKDQETGRFNVFNKSYTPEETYKQLPQPLRNKYDEFIAENSLILVPGAVNDMDVIDKNIRAFIQDNNLIIDGVGYDKAMSTEWRKLWLQNHTDFHLWRVFQGFSNFSPIMRETKKLVENQLLVHDQAIMSWTMMNLKAKTNAFSEIMPYKAHRYEKIDPVSSMFDAYIAYKQFHV